MQEKFVIFGGTHWLIFGLTAAAAAGLIFIARKWERLRHPVDFFLAGTLLASKLLTVYLAWNGGNLTLRNGLPMHLCDWATILVIITLLWPRQWLYELVYFWGLVGTIQAVLTPDLSLLFPNIRFFTFFVSHCGIIVAVLYLTLGKGMRPISPFSILWAMLATQVYIAAAGLVNWLCDANYGYLCAKPQSASLLDYMGPWPWYILSIEVLALLLFSVCYLPFWMVDLRKKN